MPMDSPSTLSSPPNAAAPGIAIKVQIVVIGAGQAGLSAAYHLKSWDWRRTRVSWCSTSLQDRGRLAGPLALADPEHRQPHPRPAGDVLFRGDRHATARRCGRASPSRSYFAAYEKQFELPVYRPVTVKVVCDRHDHFRVETDRIQVSARGLINATGTWESPYVPDIPGAERFTGRQLHTKDYRTAEEFAGRHVIVVGAGISAIQLLDEVSRVTTTTWVTRREPEFRDGPFDEKAGRAAVAIVEDRVRRGLPPASVVSVTGIPVTPAIAAMRARGVLTRRPMFSEITEDGVRWSDGPRSAPT